MLFSSKAKLTLKKKREEGSLSTFCCTSNTRPNDPVPSVFLTAKSSNLTSWSSLLPPLPNSPALLQWKQKKKKNGQRDTHQRWLPVHFQVRLRLAPECAHELADRVEHWLLVTALAAYAAAAAAAGTKASATTSAATRAGRGRRAAAVTRRCCGVCHRFFLGWGIVVFSVSAAVTLVFFSEKAEEKKKRRRRKKKGPVQRQGEQRVGNEREWTRGREKRTEQLRSSV